MPGVVWALTELALATPLPAIPVPPANDVGTSLDLITQVIAPILGTGLVGAFLIMILFRIKIMPTYVYDDAKKAWTEEVERTTAAHALERDRLAAENVDLKQGLKDSNKVYTEQVIPTLTRVLDAERELVDLRRDEATERRRRGQP